MQVTTKKPAHFEIKRCVHNNQPINSPLMSGSDRQTGTHIADQTQTGVERQSSIVTQKGSRPRQKYKFTRQNGRSKGLVLTGCILLTWKVGCTPKDLRRLSLTDTGLITLEKGNGPTKQGANLRDFNLRGKCLVNNHTHCPASYSGTALLLLSCLRYPNTHWNGDMPMEVQVSMLWAYSSLIMSLLHKAGFREASQRSPFSSSLFNCSICPLVWRRWPDVRLTMAPSFFIAGRQNLSQTDFYGNQNYKRSD